MKFEFDNKSVCLEIDVSVDQAFLGVSVGDNENLCTDNGYNGDHAYIEIKNVAAFEQFVEFCQAVVKTWESKNEKI